MESFQNTLKRVSENTVGRQYRFLIINEHYLGHTTVHRLFSKALINDPEVDFDPARDSILLDSVDNILERLQRWAACIRIPILKKYDLDFHHWRFQRYIALLARKRVQEKLRRAHYDALAFNSQTASYACADLMKKYPALISTDITNTQSVSETTNPLARWTYLPSTFYERSAFKNAKAIATFSEWARQAVLRENPGVSHDKVRCYPPGADLTQLLEIPSERASSEKLRLLFVGGDFDRKGGRDVLEVFERARLHESCELHLVSGGAPAQAEEVPGVFVYRNIKAYSPEWLERYAQADVFVLPTRSEAYGHVFVEAMAAGLPVIATSINAIPEIVGEAGLEFLILPGDVEGLLHAIERLRDAELRRKLAHIGRERAKMQFDAAVCFACYVQWLKEISSR